MNKLLSVCLLLLLSGCSTIHFTHDLPAGRNATEPMPEKWHDTTIDGMIEISKPVNLYQECRGRPWQQVTVEYTFTNGLVATVITGTAASAVPVFSWINLYMPWTVQTACSE